MQESIDRRIYLPAQHPWEAELSNKALPLTARCLIHQSYAKMEKKNGDVNGECDILLLITSQYCKYRHIHELTIGDS